MVKHTYIRTKTELGLMLHKKTSNKQIDLNTHRDAKKLTIIMPTLLHGISYGYAGNHTVVLLDT